MFRKLVPFVLSARKRLRLTWQLLNDNRIPLWQKAIPFLPLIYLLSPINFLTFFIPVIGSVDDVMLVLLALELFERMVDKDILVEYRRANNVKIEVKKK